jgi:hypothetical protein
MAAPKKKYKLPIAVEQYAKENGLRHHFFVKGGMPEPQKPPAQEALTDLEKKQAQRRKDILRQHMPEMFPILKELLAEGMITGMRNVRVSLN